MATMASEDNKETTGPNNSFGLLDDSYLGYFYIPAASRCSCLVQLSLALICHVMKQKHANAERGLSQIRLRSQTALRRPTRRGTICAKRGDGWFFSAWLLLLSQSAASWGVVGALITNCLKQ